MSTAAAVFAREAITPIWWDEFLPLFELHRQEIARHQDIPLAPHRDAYEAMDRAGAFRFYTVRMDGRAVGYAAFIVAPNPHYTSSLVAKQDVVFVLREFRGTRIGAKLLDYSEDELRAEGVQEMVHHVKPDHPALGRLLVARGYAVADVLYAKRLDRK